MSGPSPSRSRLPDTIRQNPLLRRTVRGPYRAARRVLRTARRQSTTWVKALRRGYHRLGGPVRDRADLRRWARAGRPAPPPPIVKQRLVREYGRRHGIRLLVETGTYRGDMVAAQRRNFDRIWSMELQPSLAAKARGRFAGAGNVTILEGDSAVLLPQILELVDQPCLFWLDAHYSAGVTARGDVDTPIAAELDAVLRHPVVGHVVLVDDMRDFTGENDYPTAAALIAAITERRPDWAVEVVDDVLRASARR